MESARKVRNGMLLMVLVTVVGVLLFGRKQSPERSPSDEPTAEQQLALRRGVPTVAEYRAGWHRSVAPIPDSGEPIQWETMRSTGSAHRHPSATEWRSAESPTAKANPGIGHTPRNVTSTLPQALSVRSQRSAVGPAGGTSNLAEEWEAPSRAPLESNPGKPAAKYHRIVEGESLRDIAARYLGTPDRYLELFYANRAVLPHPDVLPLGARLLIPPLDAAAERGPRPPVAEHSIQDWSELSPARKGILLPD